jgi:hypothetical protein
MIMATKTKTSKTTKSNAKVKAAKSSPQVTKPKVGNEKKLGALAAAAKVLAEKGKTLNCRELVEEMAAKGLWSSPGGQTPHATLHAAISREIKVKGKESRFTKTGPGKFARNS